MSRQILKMKEFFLQKKIKWTGWEEGIAKSSLTWKIHQSQFIMEKSPNKFE